MSAAGVVVPSWEAHRLIDGTSAHDTNRMAQRVFGDRKAPGTGVPLVFTQGETLALLIGRALVDGSTTRRHVGSVLDAKRDMLQALSAMYDRGERPAALVMHADGFDVYASDVEAVRCALMHAACVVIALATFYERLATVAVEAPCDSLT